MKILQQLWGIIKVRQWQESITWRKRSWRKWGILFFKSVILQDCKNKKGPLWGRYEVYYLLSNQLSNHLVISQQTNPLNSWTKKSFKYSIQLPPYSMSSTAYKRSYPLINMKQVSTKVKTCIIAFLLTHNICFNSVTSYWTIRL